MNKMDPTYSNGNTGFLWSGRKLDNKFRSGSFLLIVERPESADDPDRVLPRHLATLHTQPRQIDRRHFYFFWNFRFWENARHNFFDETSCETLAWSEQGEEVQPFQRKRKTAIIMVQLFRVLCFVLKFGRIFFCFQFCWRFLEFLPLPFLSLFAADECLPPSLRSLVRLHLSLLHTFHGRVSHPLHTNLLNLLNIKLSRL